MHSTPGISSKLMKRKLSSVLIELTAPTTLQLNNENLIEMTEEMGEQSSESVYYMNLAKKIPVTYYPANFIYLFSLLTVGSILSVYY
jgi:hypothetical protein